jgi:hypothetical protein
VFVVAGLFESCDNVLLNENAFRRTDDGDVDDVGDEDELFSLFLLLVEWFKREIQLLIAMKSKQNE